jgi:hypothetical protein
LNAAVAGATKDATVKGNQLVLRSVLAYSAASRSLTSQAAFEDATKFLVQNMMRSVAKKLEIELFYGQQEYAIVESSDSTSITIQESEWAPGIWAGSEGLTVQIYHPSLAPERGSGFLITAVDMENRKITFSSDPSAALVANGDRVFHKGAQGNEFAGIHKIITNSGSLFGIDASAYSLWKGNEYPISPAGALSFDSLQDGLSRAVEKGLDSAVKVYVNPRSWADLLNEQAALRQYDSSYKANLGENGSESITFYSQTGKMEIIPSIYVKEGYAYLIATEECLRVGSTDITFRRPGQGDEFFRDQENNAGYELRAYTDQALFCMAPGKMVLISGIVN